jgi:hypothetical protein
MTFFLGIDLLKRYAHMDDHSVVYQVPSVGMARNRLERGRQHRSDPSGGPGRK